MITTTLNRIRAHDTCYYGWKKLLAELRKTQADDEPLLFSKIVEINGLYDALWCCRAEPQYTREWRLFAVWCARQVQHLMPDQRSIAALDVAERYADGQATDTELTAARAAAQDAAAQDAAAWDAAAWDAAHAAARAAERDAAQAAAKAAAWASAACAAAQDAAQDADAWAAACAAERRATWDAQKTEFLRVVSNSRRICAVLGEKE